MNAKPSFLLMNRVAADVSPLHLNSGRNQSRLMSVATVQGFNARFFGWEKSYPAGRDKQHFKTVETMVSSVLF